jgi:hypothetical protein
VLNRKSAGFKGRTRDERDVQMLFRPSESREYRGTNERPSKAVVLRTYGREERHPIHDGANRTKP